MCTTPQEEPRGASDHEADVPGTQPSGEPTDPRRRRFLRGAVVATGAGLAGAAAGAAGGPAPARASTEKPVPAVVPFHGEHQAGILTPAQLFGLFASLDIQARGRAELGEMFRLLTARARTLTAGHGDEAGLLGPHPAPGRLTITVGVGASLFDERYGLARRKPAGLTPLRTFTHDRLDPAWCHGDLSLQICADHRDTVIAALRDITGEMEGAVRPRWCIDGFNNPPRPAGTQRNLMGFKDGIENPDTGDPAEMDRLVWITSTRPETAWTSGGTYQALRLIRVDATAWDQLDTTEQERAFGRRKNSGAPLSRHRERDTPDYSDDAHGHITPVDSHARLANPRTSATDHQRILRRGFNYDRGLTPSGRLDQGVAFCSYQRDIAAQFEAVQTRLDDERLTPLLTTFGGGYFLTLPGVRGSADWYAAALLR